MSTPTSPETFDDLIDSYQATTLCEKRSQSTTRDRLEWRHFAAAAGATLAGSTSTNAAIQHVVPSLPIRIEIASNAFTNIDLDGDSQDDLRAGAGYYPFSFVYSRLLGTAKGLGDARVIGDHVFSFYGNPFGAIKKFAANQVIPAVLPSIAGSIIRTSVTYYGNYVGTPNGNWDASDTGFAGFVDGPAGSRRAGWIKIRTEAGGGLLDAIEILEWAYETVPGVSIMAGATSSGGVLGDYNNNGSVGPEDYTTWKAAYGNTTLPNSNDDGIVDAVDYTVWRNNLSNPASGTGGLAASVPEPGPVTLGVLALGAAGVAALRRRQN